MTHDEQVRADQMPPTTVDSAPLLQQLLTALNRHDLDALVACFASDCASETPAHPDRGFRGRDQLRKNWSQIFAAVPDLQARLVRAAITSDCLWAEWDWHGTGADGLAFAMRGVTTFAVQQQRVSAVRFFMEPVQADGLDPDAAVRQHVGSSGDR